MADQGESHGGSPRTARRRPAPGLDTGRTEVPLTFWAGRSLLKAIAYRGDLLQKSSSTGSPVLAVRKVGPVLDSAGGVLEVASLIKAVHLAGQQRRL